LEELVCEHPEMAAYRDKWEHLKPKLKRRKTRRVEDGC